MESDIKMTMQLVLDTPVPSGEHRVIGNLRVILVAYIVSDACHGLVAGGNG